MRPSIWLDRNLTGDYGKFPYPWETCNCEDCSDFRAGEKANMAAEIKRLWHGQEMSESIKRILEMLQ